MTTSTPQVQLIGLFNAKNSDLAKALTVEDVDFGAVATYTPGDGADTRNAKLTITAKTTSANFTGEKELHYTRLPGTDLVGSKEITAPETDWDTDDKVLAAFNADVLAGKEVDGVVIQGKDSFTADDLTITRQSGVTGESITVSIKAGHIKYIEGDAAAYVITYPVQKTDLSTTNGELDGFSAA